MLKSRTTWVSPQKLFPGHNRVATGIARLCILREDIYLEFAGLEAMELSSSNPLFSVDDNGAAYRRLYFFRASLRTLTEIYGLSAIAESRKSPR